MALPNEFKDKLSQWKESPSDAHKATELTAMAQAYLSEDIKLRVVIKQSRRFTPQLAEWAGMNQLPRGEWEAEIPGHVVTGLRFIAPGLIELVAGSARIGGIIKPKELTTIELISEPQEQQKEE
jgi:hypothetical protein